MKQLIIGVILAGVCASGSLGAVRYVSSISGTDAGGGTNTSTPCRSIQYAVDQAGSGDEIHIATYDVVNMGGIPPVFLTNTCVYTGTGAAVITLDSGKSLTLKGGYVRAGALWQQGVVPPLVNGQNARRCLQAVVGDADTNHVELLELANGAAVDGANVYAAGGSLQLVGTPIHGGAATGNGGGVYMGGVDFSVSMGSYSNLSLPQMTGLLPIYSNSAARGGGLFLDGGYPLMTTVGVMGNTATGNGGGVFIKGGFPSVIGGTIQGNMAGGNGGGIYLSNSVARVGGMIVNSNRANYGGAIFLDGPFAFSMETATLIANNYIQNNEAIAGKGGGIYFNAANVGVVNNVITGNSATNGAAAYLRGSSPRFFQNTIADNSGLTALHVTHGQGLDTVVVVPPTYLFGRLVSPGLTNLLAGLPIPSQPAFTNTIISGHATALQVDSSSNSVLPNKAQLGFTLWWGNAVKTAGGGSVNSHDEWEADPRFTSKGTPPGDLTPYHLDTNSPAINSGTEIGLTLPGTDLLLDIDAQLRPSGQGMDIGADEVVTDPFSVFFVPAAISKSVSQPGVVVTNEHMLLNSGTQSDTYTLSASNSLWSGSVVPAAVVLASQSYTTVVVRVTVPGGAANGTTNMTLVTAVSQADSNKFALALDSTALSTNPPGPAARYVWQASPTPSTPYTSPDTAGHDIQTVVEACVAGDTVLVYPGSYGTGGAVTPGYSLTNRVCVTNAITVVSLAGPDNTQILGAADPAATNGPAAVRCLYVSTNATVSGFTFMDGHTQVGSDWHDIAGGGVCIGGGAIISNSTIAGCTASTWGGGLYIATASTAWAIHIRGCSTRSANGLSGNGGGAYLGNNSALYNCLVYENAAAVSGGGVFLISGGGAYNCTIVSNASAEAGGVYVVASVALNNNIIYFNSAPTNANLTKGSAAIQNGCTTPDPGGTGIVTNDPRFMGGGDYHLQSNSPCIDRGTTDHAPSHDLDGNRRPLDGDAVAGAAMDIGCYEVYNAAGDSDGDGAKDGDELTADTDPMNGTDFFHIVALSNAPVAKVYFTASSNRSYSLEYGTNLLTNLWWVVSGQSNIPGKGPRDSLSDTNAAGTNRFYRLRVVFP